ncbi:hypothetical protein Ddye_014944 [Dipteronia dyeriana]|uniref:Cation/H+ exchanger domain-containing protein n=1 Tax=Dipteronia dyeriana TaxID=168575 RepID=A0AAD9U4U2_9ROSI|nr:hypothetical protein Ddye_014944 [Dipteronia dyeriana]
MDSAENRTPQSLYCEPTGSITSGGLLFGHNITNAVFPLLLMQISLANLFTAIFQILLKPFGQFSFIPQLLGGITIGPSCLSRYEKISDHIFSSKKGVMMVNAFENVGLIFLFFLLSVQIDLNVLKRPGKLAFAIGISALILPFLITLAIALFLKEYISDEELQGSLSMVAFLESGTSFHQILYFLKDLKMLNSELSRIALVSALISGIGNWVYLTIIDQLFAYSKSAQWHTIVFALTSHLFMIIVIVFAFRPLILWMMRKTPERKSLKESHVAVVIIMVLCCALYAEIIGLHPLHGPIVLGMATPDSPPMGSTLSNQFGCFVWGVLMPGFMINVGKRINLFELQIGNFLIVAFITFTSGLAKFIGTLVPSLYFKMPLRDAFPLGLILSGRGLFDILFFYRAKQAELISDEIFGIMAITVIVHSAIIAPIVRAVYDTTKRYMAYNRRTIQHTKQQGELRIVACIHEPDSVLPILNILEISTPTEKSPLAVYVLNLEELTGRTMPIFIPHQYSKTPTLSPSLSSSSSSSSSSSLTSLAKVKPTRASRILNVFHQYEQQRGRSVVIQCFTSVAPYSTMHDDIISLAHNKCTTLVIIPFEKFDSPYVRTVNKNVLEHVPCSVAIFLSRGILVDSKYLHSQPVISVCVIFIGGCDDREALAYGARMYENPNILLTIVVFIDANAITNSEFVEKRHDQQAVANFRINSYENTNVTYKEERLAGVSDTINALQLIEKDYDLILVGRRHNKYSTLLKGLSDWSEFEELGVIGDIFASSDIRSRASLLVVQQQASVVEEMIET